MPVVSISDLKDINFNVNDYSDIYKAYTEDLMSYVQTFSGDSKKHRDTGTANNNNLASRHLLNELVGKWQPILGFSIDRIREDIRDIQTPKTDRITSLSLREALKYYKPGSNWLVPNLIRSTGLYILAGEPKAGKSWFVYHLMYALTIKQEFLGRPVKNGKVLFLQLEEPLETISERFFLCGFGDMASEETSLIVNFKEDIIRVERNFDVINDLNWLTNLIDEYQPVLTIIDSLRASTLKSNASENSNEMGKAVYGLQQVFNFTNTCGILIHHMNKPAGRDRRKTSLVERISGHASISGATDGLIGISSEETPEGRLMILKTLPRNGISIEIQYKMVTNEGGLCELEKIKEDTPASLPITGKILRFLANSPDSYYSAKLIAKGIEDVADNPDFKKALSYLQNSQLISSRYHNKCFQYTLTSDSLWIVNPTDITEDLRTPTILDANAMMKCTTKRELRNLVIDWESERRTEAMEYLYPSERERLSELIRSWEFDIGDEVVYQDEIFTVEDRLGKATFSKSRYILSSGKEVLEIDLEPHVEVEVELDSSIDDMSDLFNVFSDEDCLLHPSTENVVDIQSSTADYEDFSFDVA